MTKSATGEYESRSIALPLQSTLQLRTDLLAAAVRSFQPDLLLVDHAPAGLAGELLPLFRHLGGAGHRPRLVAGLRDVIDEPHRVRGEWNRTQVWRLLREVYDTILVYGDPRLPTTAQDLGLDLELGDKLSFTGYVAAPSPSTHKEEPPLVLVTTGGGGDGQRVLRAYLKFLASLTTRAPFRSVIVTGPLLSSSRRREVSTRLEELDQDVELMEFTPRLKELVSCARGVVTMAGYNTTIEVLAAGTPALLVPREHPRKEQLIRARRLAGLTGIEMCPMGSLQPAVIARFVARALSGAAGWSPGVALDGLSRVAEELERTLYAESSLPARRRAGAGVARRVS